MFDTMATAKRIRDARNAKNMTQMELADKMGVSFQAVSNWERGASMPDIGKISDLAEVLSVDISDILGKGRADKAVEKVMKNEETSIGEIVEVAPILPPKTVEKIVKESSSKVSVEDLAALAPFLSSSALSSIMRDVEVDDISSLTALAPFLEREDLSMLVEKSGNADIEDLVALAPFLDGDELGKIARKTIGGGKTESIAALAPFLEEDDLEALVNDAICSHDFSPNDIQGVLPHLDSDKVKAIFDSLIGKVDTEELVSMAPFMDEDDLSSSILSAISEGNMGLGDIMAFAPFLDSDMIGDMVKMAAKRNR